MNSDLYRTRPADAPCSSTGQQPQYRISLTLAVSDARALWTAAAARLLAAPCMVMDDVIDVIGPCDDPSISECISAIAKPDALAGCALDDFWIDGLSGCPPRLEPLIAVIDCRPTVTALPRGDRKPAASHGRRRT